MKKNGKEKKKD